MQKLRRPATRLMQKKRLQACWTKRKFIEILGMKI
jgi:hypothetical protein